CARIQSNFDFW
nr:immunoglobulin heavy chain junction region [Macaca mulatta]MOW98180.1 immunoglobulin heavy chain junction region [Macaca mulatta]MOW99972.1 immunoglobulin heavy chain junction region [Macaca mulatta]MOX00611.1 immunoglobulin heavy chain junction region [Macaca mulatta]MOX01000.1 immunoglobulin heavy chain junction region [Macaca mulatta]